MKKIFSYILLALLLPLSVMAIPNKPSKAVLVNDFAHVFSAGQSRALEQKLVAFDSQTSTQIAIVTLNDLEGMASIDMATRLMETWGVGGKEDNGIVILFKPKTASSNGQVAITTGYGVEHLVTDALAKQIVEFDMIPLFKQGDVYGGVDKAATTLMGLTSGEFTGTEYLSRQKKGRSGSGGIFFILFFLLPLLMSRNKRRHGQFSSSGSSLPFWMLMGMMGGGGSRGGSSFDDFSSGGGSFGGFGGGMGGGGGASGSW